MKKVKDWFEELPEPYRTQAIENSTKEELNCIEESLTNALSGSFFWFSSPQGQKYWGDLYEKLL